MQLALAGNWFSMLVIREVINMRENGFGEGRPKRRSCHLAGSDFVVIDDICRIRLPSLGREVTHFTFVLFAEKETAVLKRETSGGES